MKRISRSSFLLLLSFTVIGAFSVMPVYAHDNGDDSPEYFMRAIACEYSKNLNQDLVKAYLLKHGASISESEDDTVTWKPVLYRWDGVRFFKWKEFEMPSAYSGVTPDSMKDGKHSGWRDSETGKRSIPSHSPALRKGHT
ncbi:hypothetical protein [Planococcus koreensis]|uniref:hypothetical protein n=1 Tax=Planococcus koreensis TaxID=112331 RepID=UPI0039FCE265